RDRIDGTEASEDHAALTRDEPDAALMIAPAEIPGAQPRALRVLVEERLARRDGGTLQADLADLAVGDARAGPAEVHDRCVDAGEHPAETEAPALLGECSRLAQ